MCQDRASGWISNGWIDGTRAGCGGVFRGDRRFELLALRTCSLFLSSLGHGPLLSQRFGVSERDHRIGAAG